jgi:transcriptional regulator with XRE-family HTH domain
LEFNTLKTIVLDGELGDCEDLEDLKEKIFPRIKRREESWKIKICGILSETGYTKAKFAGLCGVSRVALNKWCNGSIPRNRETFLRIGIAAGYGEVQINRLLQRYGLFPGLYSKNLEDLVCRFVINRDYGLETMEKYDYILERIKEAIIPSDTVVDMSTEMFDEKLSVVRDENELQSFIAENSSVFLSAYHRFYAYVKMNIEANYSEFGGSVFELAEGQGWSSSLRQCVSAIRQNKWYPTRNKIISLGLHLSMDREQIDEMLGLARMEPLCAKNLFESIIIFVLEDACLNNMLDTESEEYDPDELCRYAREVLDKLGMPELEFFKPELSEMDEDA